MPYFGKCVQQKLTPPNSSQHNNILEPCNTER
jgi:hypothetical protein